MASSAVKGLTKIATLYMLINAHYSIRIIIICAICSLTVIGGSDITKITTGNSNQLIASNTTSGRLLM